LEDSGGRLERRRILLLGVVSEDVDHDPLEKADRQEPAEDRRPYVGREGAEQAEVDADEPVRSLTCHRVGDRGALVTSLGNVAPVTETTHELRPGARHAAGIPAEL